MKKAMIALLISIICILALFLFTTRYQLKKGTAHIMMRDMNELSSILQQIDRDCGIVSFDSVKTPINFLNVVSFVGSEVGGVNLAHPDKWQGPYLKDNPTIQSIEYQIVNTKDGYFIMPGDGVTLPNGKVIGKDLIINASTHMMPLMQDKNALLHDNVTFAIPLNIDVNIKSALADFVEEDEM